MEDRKVLKLGARAVEIDLEPEPDGPFCSGDPDEEDVEPIVEEPPCGDPVKAGNEMIDAVMWRARRDIREALQPVATAARVLSEAMDLLDAFDGISTIDDLTVEKVADAKATILNMIAEKMATAAKYLNEGM